MNYYIVECKDVNDSCGPYIESYIYDENNILKHVNYTKLGIKFEEKRVGSTHIGEQVPTVWKDCRYNHAPRLLTKEELFIYML